jgi:hypothetical protein
MLPDYQIIMVFLIPSRPAGWYIILDRTGQYVALDVFVALSDLISFSN